MIRKGLKLRIVSAILAISTMLSLVSCDMFRFRAKINAEPLSEQDLVRILVNAINDKKASADSYAAIPEIQRDGLSYSYFIQFVDIMTGISQSNSDNRSVSSFRLMTDADVEDATDGFEDSYYGNIVGAELLYGEEQQSCGVYLLFSEEEDGMPYLSEEWISDVIDLYNYGEHYFDMIDFSGSKYPCERFVERIDIDPPCGNVKITKLVPMEGVSAEWCAIEDVEDIAADATQGYSTFRGGDVIWARITPCMENGKSAVVEAEPSECFCGSTEFLVFRPKDDGINPYYLQSLLHLNRFREVAAHHFTGTSGHQRVTADFFKSISIPIPPRSVQDRIASKASSIRAEARKLKADATAALDAAKRKIESRIIRSY